MFVAVSSSSFSQSSSCLAKYTSLWCAVHKEYSRSVAMREARLCMVSYRSGFGIAGHLLHHIATKCRARQGNASNAGKHKQCREMQCRNIRQPKTAQYKPAEARQDKLQDKRQDKTPYLAYIPWLIHHIVFPGNTAELEYELHRLGRRRRF